jgi:hypothetical protein
MSFATQAVTERKRLVEKICAAAKHAAKHTSPESLTTVERDRVKDAFQLLFDPQQWEAAPKYQSKVNYKEYLERVQKQGNLQLVMVFILGLGAYVICTLKKCDRLQLLEDIEREREEWDIPVIQSLAQDCWIEGHITALSSQPGG